MSNNEPVQRCLWDYVRKLNLMPDQPRVESNGVGSYWDALSDNDDEEDETAHGASSLDKEIASFTSKPRMLDKKANPVKWWQMNHEAYPLLARCALRYLSPPPTSVESERTFSAAGNVVTPTRSRLHPERVEMLTFLRANLQVLDFKY